MSLRGGVAVLDSDLRVRLWNAGSEDLWGLRSPEVVGQVIDTLDIGLPVDQLVEPARAILAGECESQELVLRAVNRRGRPLTCRVDVTPLTRVDGLARGVVLVMEEAVGAGG